MVAVADTQVTEPGDIASDEPGRSGGADRARTSLIDRAAQHVDAERVPAVAGQVQGVTASSATQVECASRRERIYAFHQFHQPRVGYIGGCERRIESGSGKHLVEDTQRPRVHGAVGPYAPEPKLRRSVSPFGFPPNAADI